MEPALVVHLVAPDATVVGSGWDAPDGSVRHVAASWREMPPTIADADVVVAHGVPALVVVQLLAAIRPHLVYRPTETSKLRRRRGRRRLHASWVAASDKRTGRRAAKTLGLGKDRVVVVRDAEPADWNALVREVLQRDAPAEVSSPADIPPPAEVPSPAEIPPADVPPPLDDVAPDDDIVPGATRDRSGRSSRVVKWTLSRFAPSPPPGGRVRPLLPPAPPPPPPPPPPVSTLGDAAEPEPTTVLFPGVRLPEPEPSDSHPIAALPNLLSAAPAAWPPRLDVGVADPTSAGQPWWKYRRMDVPGTSRGAPDAAAASPAASGSDRSGPPPANGERTPDPDSEPDPEAEPGRNLQIITTLASRGVGFFVLGAALLATVVICAQTGKVGEAPFLIPAAGFFLTVAAGQRITQNHPDEPWVARWLLLGLVAKLVAAYIRYYTLTVTYNNVGDASQDYDTNGRAFAQAWHSGGRAPKLTDLRETNFIRWFTGVVYYVFGSSLLAGTFVFALLALIGSYFWYRATVEAVPMLDRRLYLGFVLFAPSIVFWPALVGKEALMQLALGTFALGMAFMLRQRLFPGLAIGVAGGWLMWVVRPHLLAIVAIAAGAAYLAGRVRRDGVKKPGLLSRPIGIIVVALLVAFTITQGAKFLGLSSLSLSSVQTELDATTASTAQGGSAFHSGKNSLSPLYLPRN
ncbi:MAG: hypothetical protein QOF28_2080, partial [Actinomycetota bacterium]|nr:hypothetical protein [Actinomycetota bacterium]